MNYIYTIIIPHKNIPDLLIRCLDSIPEREDTQIIIIDDNSDSTVVDFNNFPGRDRINTEIIFSKEGKGAGYARNLGLSYIKESKWISFIDADDFFSENANGLMDKYVICDADIVFFALDTVFSDSLLPSNRKVNRNNKFDKAIETCDYDILRYKMYGPTTKFISFKLIKENNIKFDEVYVANDVMFTIKIGYFSKIILTDLNVLYIATEREGSLVKTINYESIKTRYYVSVNALRFLRNIEKTKYHPNLFSYTYYFFKINLIHAIKYFFLSFYYTPFNYWIQDLILCFKYFINRSKIDL